jgi:hypothetical protein
MVNHLIIKWSVFKNHPINFFKITCKPCQKFPEIPLILRILSDPGPRDGVHSVV